MRKSLAILVTASFALQSVAGFAHAEPKQPAPPNDTNKSGENWDRTPQGDPQWEDCALIAERSGKDAAAICFWFATMMDRKNRH